MEWVDVVDADDQVVRVAPRSEVRRGNLLHRATYILVQRSSGRIVVQRRTLTKDFCPGMLDVCCGGVVTSGEEYDESARRELAEELGVEQASLKGFGTFHSECELYRVWGALYHCIHDGPLVLQAEEVAAVEEMTLAEIRTRADEFTPDSLIALEQLIARGAPLSFR